MTENGIVKHEDSTKSGAENGGYRFFVKFGAKKVFVFIK